MARKSILQNKEKVSEAWENTSSIREALHYLGLRSAGGNYKSFHEACKKFGLEVKKGHPDIQTLNARLKTTIPLENLLVENSTYSNRADIKRRCYKEEFLIEKCYECGIGPEWNGKPLTLQLEHINGIYNDNRIENLAILCPNCHSQTTTFAGRKIKSKEKRSPNRKHLRKFHIEKEELSSLLGQHSMVTIGKMFGVSDNAVRKRAKIYGLL